VTKMVAPASLSSWHVDPRRRLVEEEEPRPVHDADRQAGALANRGGQVLGLLALGLGEREAVAQGAPAARELRAREPVEPGVELDVLTQGEALVQAHLLAHVADPVAHAARVADDVHAVHLDRTRRRPDEADQHADGRALAGAVGAEEGEDRARRHLDREIGDRGEGAEALGEPAGADDRRGHHPPPESARRVDSMSSGVSSAKLTAPPATVVRSASRRVTPGASARRTSMRAKRPVARAPST